MLILLCLVVLLIGTISFWLDTKWKQKSVGTSLAILSSPCKSNSQNQTYLNAEDWHCFVPQLTLFFEIYFDIEEIERNQVRNSFSLLTYIICMEGSQTHFDEHGYLSSCYPNKFCLFSIARFSTFTLFVSGALKGIILLPFIGSCFWLLSFSFSKYYYLF
jgi:hypothetical protein